MKLRQGQVCKLDNRFLRIVVLERLAVEYKSMADLETKEGTHHRVTKKEFCALVKGLEPVEPKAKK